MKPNRRPTNRSRQRPLPFSATNDQVDLWNNLTGQQKPECRQILSQMLVAVARHARNAVHDNHDLHARDSE
jgi:enhancing lycopene biosynthesis protein 2